MSRGVRSVAESDRILTDIGIKKRIIRIEVSSPKGGFVLDDPESFKQALDDVLAMPFEEVLKVRNDLKAKFSKANCVEAAVSALQEICPTR